MQRPLNTNESITAYNQMSNLFDYLNANISGVEMNKSKIWCLNFEKTNFRNYVDALVDENTYKSLCSSATTQTQLGLIWKHFSIKLYHIQLLRHFGLKTKSV